MGNNYNISEDVVIYWADELGLMDWYIRVVVVSKEETDGNWGLVEYNTVHKSAKISISKHYDDYESAIVKYDMEVILVHELLHLKFSILEKTLSDLQYEIYHQGINDIAVSLVMNKRGLRSEDISNV